MKESKSDWDTTALLAISLTRKRLLEKAISSNESRLWVEVLVKCLFDELDMMNPRQRAWKHKRWHHRVMWEGLPGLLYDRKGHLKSICDMIGIEWDAWIWEVTTVRGGMTKLFLEQKDG